MHILVELIDLVNSVLIVLSQMTLLRLLTFLLRSLTVILTVLLLWIYFFLLMLVNKKNFKAPFCGWDSTASRLEPLRGGNSLFTTKFPETPGTHFIDLGKMKG